MHLKETRHKFWEMTTVAALTYAKNNVYIFFKYHILLFSQRICFDNSLVEWEQNILNNLLNPKQKNT
jgi:hypothetical protein